MNLQNRTKTRKSTINQHSATNVNQKSSNCKMTKNDYMEEKSI